MAKKNSLVKRKREYEALVAAAKKDEEEREKKRVKKAEAVKRRLEQEGVSNPSVVQSRKALKMIRLKSRDECMGEPAPLMKVRKNSLKKVVQRKNKRERAMTKEIRKVNNAILMA